MRRQQWLQLKQLADVSVNLRRRPTAPQLLRSSVLQSSSTRGGVRWLAVSKVENDRQKGKVLGEYEKLLARRTERAVKDSVEEVNYKRKLFVLSSGKVPPRFQTKENQRDGKHSCSLKLMGMVFHGHGDSKFEAEQMASKAALEGLPQAFARKKMEPENLRPVPPRQLVEPSDPEKWTWLPKLKGGPEGKPLDAVPHPWAAPVPELAHGLNDVLSRDNSVATILSSRPEKGKIHNKYLQKIEQPDNINWENFTPFVPPSFDETLHNLSVQYKKKYKASTSSITSLLGQTFQLLSNDRPVDTSCLSNEFRDMPTNFTVTLKNKPVKVLLRQRDGVWGIDSEPDPERNNQILIDLGKTMERMLTMDQDSFRKYLLKPLGSDDSVDVPEDFHLGAYNFSMTEDFMFRSQLDCIHGKRKIFDIKTRATHAIRNCFNMLPDVPRDERHLYFTDYKISKQEGLWYSFEREVYDMIRAAFLKYASQCRIGRMHGAFVAYHNTREIFGFQYVDLDFMDTCVYGSPYMAKIFFRRGTQLIAQIFDFALKHVDGDKAVRISLRLTRQRKMIVQVQEVLSETEIEGVVESDDKTYDMTFTEPKAWWIFVKTEIDGVETSQPWSLKQGEDLQVRCAFEEVDMEWLENYEGGVMKELSTL